MSPDEFEALEKSEGFHRFAAECAAEEYVGGGLSIFESRTPGVIAVERLSSRTSRAVDYDDLARVVSDMAGAEVICIADCEWSFDDSCDEEATLIAFDIPSVPEDYRSDYRNMLSATARGMKA